jgi:hypothetical protein
MEYFEFSALGEYLARIRTFFAKSAPQVLPIIARKTFAYDPNKTKNSPHTCGAVSPLFSPILKQRPILG